MRNLDTLTTAQVAARLGSHPRHVLRLVDRGALEPTAKLPGKTGAYLFDAADVALIAKERTP